MKQVYVAITASVTATIEVEIALPSPFDDEDLHAAIKAALKRCTTNPIIDVDDVDDVEYSEFEVIDNHDVD